MKLPTNLLDAEKQEMLEVLNKKGLCYTSNIKTKIFYSHKDKEISLAYRTCAICPVRVDCLIFAVNNHEYGIWGGTNENQRKRIRTGSNKSTETNDFVHGKGEESYIRHIKQGTIPCEECCEGWIKTYPIQKPKGRRKLIHEIYG